jgi:hypothetical protein
MIKIENTEVVGWESAIRGMRNPMNSWGRSDSDFKPLATKDESVWCIGNKDYTLMMKLAKAGSVHAKYRRMIAVYLDITAPLYWWKEFDTYKVGTVANSCSTMHKIAGKAFTLNDFSYEHIDDSSLTKFDYKKEAVYAESAFCLLKSMIIALNIYRERYLQTGDKKYWWQMIQLLPSSYNQRRTVMLNYEVLANIYRSRKNHKLDEWRKFCEWIENLPYSKIITINGREVEE